MNKTIKYLGFGLVLLIGGVLGIYKIIETQDIVETQDIASPDIASENNVGAQYIAPQQNLASPPRLNIIAGGDVMMSRHVGTKIREANDNAMPFRKISEIFSQGDIAFINLESPFYDQGGYVTEGMVFKTEPEYISGLVEAGIDIVSLANNHMRNRGKAGLVYSLDYLIENNIKYAGAGKDFESAHQAGVIEYNELKVAFLAYTYSDGNNFVSSVGTEEPDVAFMDIEQMKKDVELAKEAVDIVIVSMHAGIEYKSYPNQQQQEFARAAVDSGAELVLGHHPHVVQTTENYHGAYIIYSLGNLVFDQMWSQETREGVIAKCNFENNDIQSIEFIPTIIENYSQPRLANEAESVRILGRMKLEGRMVNIK